LKNRCHGGHIEFHTKSKLPLVHWTGGVPNLMLWWAITKKFYFFAGERWFLA